MLRNPEPGANLGRLDDHLLYFDSRVCTTLRGVSKSGLARRPILIIGFFHESLVAKPLDGRKFPGDSRSSPLQSFPSLLLFPLFSHFTIMQKDGKLLLLSLDSILYRFLAQLLFRWSLRCSGQTSFLRSFLQQKCSFGCHILDINKVIFMSRAKTRTATC
jgi:hypothetical protein